MNKKLLIVLLLVFLISTVLIIYSAVFNNSTKDEVSQDQPMTDWSELRTELNSNCKENIFPTGEEQGEYLTLLSDQQPRLDQIKQEFPQPYQIMTLPTNSQSDLEDPNSPMCFIAYSTYIDDYTEVIYQTREEQFKILQVTNFPVFE